MTITPYVNVEDLGAIEEKIARLGGRIHKSRQEVPGRGWFTLFSDPDGNVIGVWQALMTSSPAPRPKAVRKIAGKTARNAAGKTTNTAGAKARTKSAKKAARKAPAKKAAARKGARRARRAR